MRSTTRKSIVFVALSAFALGAGSVFALGPAVKQLAQSAVSSPTLPIAADNPAPPAKGQPADADWFPKQKDGEWTLPPSAFPDLGSLDVNDRKATTTDEYLTKNCPHLTGKIPLTIAPADGPFQKLLKARIYQSVSELQRMLEVSRLGAGGWTFSFRTAFYDLLSDAESSAIELWAGQPKELIPWLEEGVVAAKRIEIIALSHVQKGTDSLHALNVATRYRLAAEAALWKAKKAR